MKNFLSVHFIALLIGFSSIPASAGFFVGGQLDILNFYLKPDGAATDNLDTGTNAGIGKIFGGYSLGDWVSVGVFIGHDRMGSISGSGTLFGQTGTFDGNFKLTSYGIEAWLEPPLVPIYIRGGIGLASLSSEVTVNLVNSTAIDAISAKWAAHFGVGLSISLMVIDIFGGIDGVFVKIDDLPAGSTDVSGIPFFRIIAGAKYAF